MSPQRRPAATDPEDAPSDVVPAAAVVCPGGVVERAEVVVRHGRIERVRPARGAVPDLLLVPGFVDLQVNGIGPVDIATAAGADWDDLDRALLAHGVTTWCPTLTSAPLADLESALARVAAAAGRDPARRPHIAGAHLEGPFLAVPGAHRRASLLARVEAGWLEAQVPGLRVVTLAPELPGALDAVRALEAAGVLVSLGHSACDAGAALEAAAAGARLVTHVGNATGPMAARAPGLLGAALAEPRLSVGLIADLVHSHPVFLRAVFGAKGPGAVALVTDTVAVAGGPGGAGPRVAPDGVARLPDGRLAGSVLTMDGALSNTVTCGAVDLAGAVAAASTTPARLLGLTDRGAIAPGLWADLTALAPAAASAGWRVAAVWVHGALAWRG